MGGYGSGGWNATGRPTTAEKLVLSVNVMLRDGCLAPGASACMTWTRDGEEFAKIGTAAAADGVVLSYEANGTPCEDRVGLEWKPCHFGGRRPYFQCPSCGRRAEKLYGPRFKCRKCANVVYPCQRESGYHRSSRRADRLRMKLGGASGITDQIPEKPKWMRWATYDRLVAEIDKAEAMADDFTLRLIERLYRRYPETGFWR